MSTANTRCKRKNKTIDIKIEPAMKALKKNDIIIQFKAHQKKYEDLEEQNKSLILENKNQFYFLMKL